jgi:hypothetical protein
MLLFAQPYYQIMYKYEKRRIEPMSFSADDLKYVASFFNPKVSLYPVRTYSASQYICLNCFFDLKKQTFSCDTFYHRFGETGKVKLPIKKLWTNKNKSSSKNLPKIPTHFVEKKGDTILTFSCLPSPKDKGQTRIFKDTTIWAILDTNIVHIQPFMFGFFNIFAPPTNAYFDILNILKIDNENLHKPQEIQFLGSKVVKLGSFTQPQKVLDFRIRPVLAHSKNAKRCWEQQIRIHAEDLFLVASTVSACDCISGEIILPNVQTIEFNSVEWLNEMP